MMRVYVDNVVHWLRTPSPLPRWGFILSVLVVTGLIVLSVTAGFYDKSNL